MVVIGLGLYAWLGKTMRIGNVFGSVGLVYVTSPVLMFAVWFLLQQGEPRLGSMDLRQVSFAALVGDLVVLPIAVGLIATGWRTINHEALASFWQSTWWFWLSFVIGLIAGIGFHLSGGKADSSSLDENVRLHDSPTSWAHNLGVFPALFGVMVYTLLPLLVTSGEHRAWAWWALGAAVVGWGGLSVLDGIRMQFPVNHLWRFNPHFLDKDHTVWSRWWTHILWTFAGARV